MELKDQPARNMGEVKVQVKLTNPRDADDAEDRLLDAGQVRTVTATGMVDTGAVRSVLPPHVVERLGLKIRRQQVVEYADGRKESVGVVRGVIFEIMERHAAEEAYVLGDEVLIGQTVLEVMDLLVDCKRRCLVPNPAHPDQPVNKLKMARTTRRARARVRVRLSNLFDELDARKDKLPKSRIRCVSVDAVADSEPV